MSDPDYQSRRRGMHPVLWVLLGIFLFFVILFAGWRVHFSFKVRSELTALQKAGHPVTLAQLEQAYYPDPGPDNAAGFFIGAFSQVHLTNSPVLTDLLKKLAVPATDPIAPLTQSESNYLAKLLAENRPALEMLHQMPPSTNCRYPIDMSLGYAMLLPHLSHLKAATQLLQLAAIRDSERGDTSGAISNLDAGLRVVDSLANEPIMISSLVRVASRKMLFTALERMLNQHLLTEPQLAHLAELFQKDEITDPVQRGYEGEMCSVLIIFQSSGNTISSLTSADGSTDSATATGWRFMRFFGLVDRDEAFFLKAMSDYLASAKQPYPQRLDTDAAIDNRIGRTARQGFYVMSGMLLPALGDYSLREASALANIRVAETVIAIERYRLAKSGRLPEQLSELSPSFLPDPPVDPFDGQPLRFKKLATGYEVYSIGRNRKDDGGVDDTIKRTGPDDITFTVHR